MALYPRARRDPKGIPNRMAPNTAFNFLLLGSALLLLDVNNRRGHRPADFLSSVSLISALLSVIGYAYAVPSFYGVGSYIPMALHTAIAFVLLAVGILLARAEDGIAKVITNDGPGGVVARRLLPFAIILPVGFGALALESGRRGFYDAEFGAVLHVTLLVLLFVGLIWWMAGRLYRTDAENKRHEEFRRKAQEELDRFFTVSLDMLMTAGFDGYFKRVNPAWQKTLGWTEKEMLAKRFSEFVHPEDREATVAERAKLSAGRDTVAFENRYRCKDGTYRWLMWSAKADVEKQLIFGAARDVTGRKENEEAVARQRKKRNRLIVRRANFSRA